MIKQPLFLILVLIALLPYSALGIDSRHTYRTTGELQGFGDFNGDTRLDLVVIDRSSGACRLGIQQLDGSITWHAAIPSGVPNAEAFASGSILASGSDQLAITGTSANAVHLIDPVTATSYIRPTRLLPNGIGPHSVAGL